MERVPRSKVFPVLTEEDQNEIYRLERRYPQRQHQFIESKYRELLSRNSKFSAKTRGKIIEKELIISKLSVDADINRRFPDLTKENIKNVYEKVLREQNRFDDDPKFVEDLVVDEIYKAYSPEEGPIYYPEFLMEFLMESSPHEK